MRPSKYNKHYRKVERNLRVGSRIRVGSADGFVLSINTYPNSKNHYTTASVRFYNKDLRTRHFSLGSISLKSSHLENLYTKLTGKRVSSVNLFDFIEQVMKLSQFKTYERFIRAYYCENLTRKETAERCRCSKESIKSMRKSFEDSLIQNELGLSILNSMDIDLNAPICSMLENEYFVRYLNRKGKFLLKDIKELERPDLFKGVCRGDCIALQDLHKILNS